MLLDAARELFGADGYADTTLDDVAEQAGVAKPVLYRHFGSKQLLYAQLLFEQTERMQLDIRRALGAAPANSDLALVVLDATFAFLEREPLAWQVLLPEQLSDFGEEADRAVEAANAATQRQTMVLLRSFALGDSLTDGLDPDSDLERLWAATSVGIQSQLARWWMQHPHITRTWVVERARRMLHATATEIFADSVTRE